MFTTKVRNTNLGCKKEMYTKQTWKLFVWFKTYSSCINIDVENKFASITGSSTFKKNLRKTILLRRFYFKVVNHVNCFRLILVVKNRLAHDTK